MVYGADFGPASGELWKHDTHCIDEVYEHTHGTGSPGGARVLVVEGNQSECVAQVPTTFLVLYL